MSVKRIRNLYALGDFALGNQQETKRRASCCALRDPFEHDPFKVQSYNFHYADPPAYPLQTPIYSQSNFRETRRREFLHANYNQCKSSSATSGQYPSGCYGYLGASTPAFEKNYGCTSSCYNNNNGTTRQTVLPQKPSALSLCEIQINFNRSEHAFCPKNVVINIATDKHGAITTTHNQNNSRAPTEQSFTCGCTTAHAKSRHFSDSFSDSDTQVAKQQPVKSQSRERFNKFIPFVTPPWLLCAKTSKQPPAPTNALRKRLSNQTIINNLNNSQDFKFEPLKRSVSTISNNSVNLFRDTNLYV